MENKGSSKIANRILAIALTPDGKRAVSIAYESTPYVWDLESNDKPRQLIGHNGLVRDITVAPDGKRAVSSSNDGTLKIWDLETCNEIMTLEGHSDAVIKIALTSDGKLAISVSLDHSLKLWDIEKGLNLATFTGDNSMISCAFAPSELAILAGDVVGDLHFLCVEGLSDPIIGRQSRRDANFKLYSKF